MTIRGLGLGKKSKQRGRETKCYINQEVYDQLKLQYFVSYNTDFPYGYMNDLINDCLLQRLKEIQSDPAVGMKLKQSAGIKSGSLDTPLTRLVRHLKDSVVPLLYKLRAQGQSTFAFHAQLTEKDTQVITDSAVELVKLTRAAFLEIELNPEVPQLEEPADKKPKLTDEEISKVNESLVKKLGYEPEDRRVQALRE